MDLIEKMNDNEIKLALITHLLDNMNNLLDETTSNVLLTKQLSLKVRKSKF